MNPSATLPIGIFDSGMGGLTVLNAISVEPAQPPAQEVCQLY